MKKTEGLRIAKALVLNEEEMELMAIFTKKRVGDMLPPDALVPRPGENIAIFDLRVFGPERKDWLAGLRKITGKGATLVQINRTTGKQEIVCSDSKGADLLVYTIERDNADKRMPIEKAKERARARWAKIEQDRLPDDEAKEIWFDLRHTVDICLQLMKGWSNSRAYRVFGPREKKPGPHQTPKSLRAAAKKVAAKKAPAKKVAAKKATKRKK